MTPMQALLAYMVAAYAVLFAGQAWALRRAGLPVQWPLRYRGQDARVRWANKVLVQAVWVLALLGIPLAMGMRPSRYFAPRLELARAWDLLLGFAVMVGGFAIACGLEAAAGWLRRQAAGAPGELRRRLRNAIVTPLPLALVEEAVFRGLLLELLLQAWADPAAAWPARGWPAGAVAAAWVLSSAAFSGAHFLKARRPGKPALQPALGLFVVGLATGAGYLLAGRTLWLPVGLHAAGILGTELLRARFELVGPAWLVGRRSFPHCGLIGVVTLVGVTLVLWAMRGG